MSRIAVLAVALATAAVAYAAAAERLDVRRLFSRFKASQSLPALRSTELPFSYPARLWRDGVEGEVVLRIHITSAGEVDSVVIERSSGNAELDSMAQKGALGLKYHPARQGDKAQAVWAILPVRFQQTAATISEDEG